MAKLMISIVFLLLFIGCKKSMNEMGRDKGDLIRKLKNGDVEAYHQLQIVYLDYKPEDFIPFAKYMADTVKYAPANLDIFETLTRKYYFKESNILLDSMSQNDKEEAVLYLNRARELKVDSVSKYDYIKTHD